MAEVQNWKKNLEREFQKPLDIKQWFSSYNYQSPELDTNEDFCLSQRVDVEERGLYVEDSETEDEGTCEDFTKINRSVAILKSTEEAKKHDFPTLPAVEVSTNPDSLSLPSEPPDITKWFSSYVYESPEVDSADFDVSLSSAYTSGNKKEVNKGRVDHLKEFSVTKVKDEMLSCRETVTRPSGAENNANPSTPQVPSYPDSLSPLSEPPDITKWFSSYVYESPNQRVLIFDVSLSSVYTFGNKKEIDKEREDQLKELPVTKFKDEILSCRETTTRPSGVQENKNPSVPQEDGSESSNLSLKNSFCVKRTIDEHNTLPDKSVAWERTTDEHSLPIQQDEQQLSSINHLRSPAKASCCRDRAFTETAEEKTEKKFIAAENDSGWISLNHKPREDCSKSITKERGEYISAENRLSSMKSKVRPRINKENSPVNLLYSSDGQKDKKLRREVLKETTNFDYSRVPEVAGKWKCPQRYKPNIGPPLKQLRLERWVYKM
uniref:Uncharacterized protein n=1 Tax=Chenopodium quinoa TaxID=63459 RepID=A0A803KN65_CHEQI